METIRQIIARRDRASDSEIDDMFEDFQAGLDDGEDPEELLQDIFGLEPDYIFDPELRLF